MRSSIFSISRAGRAVATSIDGVEDTIMVNESTILAGSTISGFICLSQKSRDGLTQAQAKGPNIFIELEGIESTVVGFASQHDDSDFLYTSSYLSENTSQSYKFLNNSKGWSDVSATIPVEVTNRPAEIGSTELEPVAFCLNIPEGIPSSMKYVATGRSRGNPSFPNKCEIKYRLIASASNTRFEISKPIRIITEDSNVNSDTGRRVDDEEASANYSSKQNANESVLAITVGASTIISRSSFCGLCKSRSVETYALTTSLANPNSGSTNVLQVSQPQRFVIELRDPNKQLLPVTGTSSSEFSFQVRLTGRLFWEAQGRKAEHHESWDLPYTTVKPSNCEEVEDRSSVEVLNVEIPADLRCSYSGHLIQVEHHLMVSVKCKKQGDIVATTAPIPMKYYCDNR